MELTVEQKIKLISALKIYNRNTKRVSYFSMNDAQKDLLDVLTKYNRVLVLKARRFGISTLIRSWQFVNCMSADEPHTYALLAHTSKAAQEVNKMDGRFYDNLPHKVRGKLAKRNTTTITWEKSGATIEVFTAGSKGGTRAFEAYMAHLSEFAFYDDQEETLTTVLPTVGDGQVVIESTPNIIGDKFYDLVMGAIPEDEGEGFRPGPNGWVLVFLPWYRHPEYQINPPPNFRLTRAEATLKEALGLTNRQLAWRRRERQTLGAAKFKREYPATIHEAFEASTDYYIDREAMEAVGVVKGAGADLHYAAKKIPNDSYVMGVDVSEGVGLDYSAITVMSVTTRQPVYHWRSNTTAPAKLAEKIVALGRKFNNPKTIVESNNDGKFVLYKLKEYKYPNLWKDGSGKPFKMTSATRPMVFNSLRSAIEDGLIDYLSKPVHNECSKLIWLKKRPDHPEGGHDDLAISMALCLYVLEKTPIVTAYHNRKNLADELIKKARAQRWKNPLPFSPTGGFRRN